MNSARQDVLRLFKHFGLDPGSYVDTFTASAGSETSGRSQAIPAKSAVREGDDLKPASDRDPFDD